MTRTDRNDADNVGSSSSGTGRVRKKIVHLGDFAKNLDESDEEEKNDEEEKIDKDEDEDEDEDKDEAGPEDKIRSQPLTPSRSLELPIIKHLKKGRQIKSVSPLGDPHPDPNFP
jgi:hypothetical protein